MDYFDYTLNRSENERSSSWEGSLSIIPRYTNDVIIQKRTSSSASTPIGCLSDSKYCKAEML